MRYPRKQNRLSNGLPEIDKHQWKDEVTEASLHGKVLVLLYKPGDEWCALLERQLVTVATRHPRVKMVKIVYRNAIPNFPEKNLPAILVRV